MNSTPAAPGLEVNASWNALRPILQRLGTDVSPARFMSAVVAAYRLEQGAASQDLMEGKFRKSESFADFTASLREASATMDIVAPLALGCGAGLAGTPAEFPAKVIREVIPTAPTPMMINLDAERGKPQATEARFDLIASHSFLHFSADLASVFQFLRSQLTARSVLVFGHEPNAHFWNHPALPELVTKHRHSLRSRQLLRGLVNPRIHIRNAFARLTGKSPMPFHERVNIRLRREIAIQGGLTSGELAAILDPHLPSGSIPKLGRAGLNWEELRREFLPDFRIIAERSSESRIIPSALAKKGGLPGAVSSVVYFREGK